MTRPPLRGSVYGLSIRSASPITGLPDTVPGWPEVEVVQLGHAGPPRPARLEVGERRARMPLVDGRHLLLDRSARRADFCGPLLDARSLAHPYIGPVGAVFARWDGREAFHAGGFTHAGRTFAILGAKEAGKSTLLAALTAAGASLVADDMIVTDGTYVFAGPRSIDLRPDAVRSEVSGVAARDGERHRVLAGVTAPKLKLSGVVVLAWGEGPTLTPLGPTERLERLASWRTWHRLRSDPMRLLELAALPAWELHRPRAFGALNATVGLLLATAASVG